MQPLKLHAARAVVANAMLPSAAEIHAVSCVVMVTNGSSQLRDTHVNMQNCGLRTLGSTRSAGCRKNFETFLRNGVDTCES